MDAEVQAAGEHIGASLVEAGIDADVERDGVVSIYGDEGWEFRAWPRSANNEEEVLVDLVLDRKLEIDPDNGERRLWFDPLLAEDLGTFRCDVHDDVNAIVAAVRAILAGLPGGAA